MTTNTNETVTTSTVTLPTREAALQLIGKHGLKAQQQSGFIKVTAPGGKMYIGCRENSKTFNRVDLSFEFKLGTFTKLPVGVGGSIKQQLIIQDSAEKTLEALDQVMAHLVSLPSQQPVRKERAPKAEGASNEGSVPSVEEAKAKLEKRMAHIEKVMGYSADKGTPVSPKLVAEYEELKAQLQPQVQAAE